MIRIPAELSDVRILACGIMLCTVQPRHIDFLSGI